MTGPIGRDKAERLHYVFQQLTKDNDKHLHQCPDIASFHLSRGKRDAYATAAKYMELLLLDDTLLITVTEALFPPIK